MPQGQGLDQLHVRAAELIQREAIVHVLLAAHDRVQHPVHQLRGQALRFVELRGVELVEIAQAAARQRDALQRPGARVRRQLLFHPVLLGAAEKAGRGGEIRIAPDPLGGEVIEESSKVALLRRCDGRPRDSTHAQQEPAAHSIDSHRSFPQSIFVPKRASVRNRRVWINSRLRLSPTRRSTGSYYPLATMARASQPLRRRLMAIMLLTSAAAIVLTCSALVLYELVSSRDESLEQVATLARIVSANSTAALAFRDDQDAQEVLATLRTEPSIVAAALYDEGGEVFAAYAAPSTPADTLPRQLGPDGYSFNAGRLEGFEPVRERPDRRLGTLYIRADTSALYARFWLWGAIAAAAMVASLLLAYFLSRIFQARISQPVLSLAETASAVSERGDFSVRAPSIGEGEFEVLTTAFNQMLARIESQNDALRETLQERDATQRKLQSQVARLDLLQRATHAIGERQDLDSIFQVVVRSLEDNVPIDFACMCMYDATARRLTVANIGPKGMTRSAQLQIEPGGALPIEQNGLSRCVQGVLVYEPDTRKVHFPVPQRFAAAGLHALVAAPLLVESQVFGVLLAARSEAESFSSGDCEFLRQLSEHVALAAHQAQLYAKLQQAYQDLRESQDTILQQERLRALGQMASGIAHDINNAISPVTLYTDTLLEKETEMSAQGRDYLRIIRRAVDDVGQTVARMREFYRQRERSSDLAAARLESAVNQVLALTSARWRDLPQERGIVIDVRTELASGLPRILGTESDIRDALTNLIFNAVDAMPEGGTLTLRTRRSHAAGRARRARYRRGHG